MYADTPLDEQAREHILAQLDEARRRFAAILGDKGRTHV